MIQNLPTPYNARETLGWLWRNLVGPSRRNPAGVGFLPDDVVLNDIAPRFRAAFIGDIMGLRGRRLLVAAELADFVRDCDALIGNFEGTVTGAPRRAPFDQAHDDDILRALGDLFPPEKTWLSVANNHGGDFGPEAFVQSLATIRAAGFRVFGTADAPGVRVAPELFVSSATRWSNRPCPAISHWDAVNAAESRADALRVFFPHWGYELECYPRPETVAAGRELLAKFDAVIGHHSHTPQPVTAIAEDGDAPARLLAYSLGDFCFFGARFAAYSYGIAVKIDIGRTAAGRWAVGRVQRTFVQNVMADGAVRVEARDAISLFP